jgi:5'-nucleotidase
MFLVRRLGLWGQTIQNNVSGSTQSFLSLFASLSVLLAVLVGVPGCSSAPSTSRSSLFPQARTVPTPPEKAFQSEHPDHVTIAIVGINDFHGHVMAKERKLSDGRVVQSGGAPVLSSMLKILREEMRGNVLLVDAGDEWQGTLESNQVKGSIVMEFFNRIGMNVAAIGNHEFDFGLENLVVRAREARYPYVAANIFERKSGQRVGPSLGWPNVYPSRSFEVAGIKIGVIGASTQETPSTTRYDVVAPYEFRNPRPYLEQESKNLRSQGASAVLMTSHAGTVCQKTDELRDWTLLSRDSKQGECRPQEEMSRVFSQLKPGTLDGAVLGHTHQVVHHWVHGIPSIEDEAFNQYFNVLYLTFHKTTKKLLPELTRIEGLIPICAEMFERLYHCDTRRLPDGFSPGMVQATFHGKKVIPDPELETWLKPILESTEKFRKDVIAVAEMPIQHDTQAESMFGNLVANVFLDKSGADFALVNARGIRNPLEAGPITADSLYRALPFDNFINVISLSGRDLKLMLRIGTSGAHDFSPTAGLRLKLIPMNKTAPATDLNGDGKLDNWETNRLLEVTDLEGRALDDQKVYRLATFDFLVNGGDDMAWFMKRIPKNKIDRGTGEFARDVIAGYLKRKQKINTRDEPLLDPLHPRVILAQ